MRVYLLITAVCILISCWKRATYIRCVGVLVMWVWLGGAGDEVVMYLPSPHSQNPGRRGTWWFTKQTSETCVPSLFSLTFFLNLPQTDVKRSPVICFHSHNMIRISSHQYK